MSRSRNALAPHDHPSAPDGIEYRSSHDDSLLCVALFGDRAGDALDVATLGAPLFERRQFLAQAVTRYRIRLL